MNPAIAWLKDKHPDEQMAEIQRRFRIVFDGIDGTFVLAVLLDDLGFWRNADSPGTMELKNFGTFLLRDRLGMRDLVDVTQALLTTEPKEIPHGRTDRADEPDIG
jgi:hypothetical protein